MSCSTSYRSPLHTGLNRHSEEMERFIGQEVYTRHWDRRTWNESTREASIIVSKTKAHVLIRSNGQLQKQGKKFERSATRRINLFRYVFLGITALYILITNPQTLANEAHVDYNHFIRTSEPDHRFAVQHFWVRTIARHPHASTDNREAHAQRTRLDLFQKT